MGYSQRRDQGVSQETLKWLLQEDNPSVRYLALKSLLGRPESDPEVGWARGTAWSSESFPRSSRSLTPAGTTRIGACRRNTEGGSDRISGTCQNTRRLLAARTPRDSPAKIDLLTKEDAVQVVIRRGVRDPTYARLLSLYVQKLLERYGERVVSILVYGSLAREEMHETSDIDLLLVIQGVPSGSKRYEEVAGLSGDEIRKLALDLWNRKRIYLRSSPMSCRLRKRRATAPPT